MVEDLFHMENDIIDFFVLMSENLFHECRVFLDPPFLFLNRSSFVGIVFLPPFYL